MAAKIFEVNDVLPATTQLRISWVDDIYELLDKGEVAIRYEDNLGFSRKFIYVDMDEEKELHISLTSSDILICHMELGYFEFPYTNYDGNHPYCDIDTSTWDINRRTITAVEAGMDIFTWEDLNAPSGYTITFNSNGGTDISDIEEATTLPTPLPTPTKPGYTFLGWYYDSDFTNEAFADDPLTSDVTLYAKWELITYTITYNSNGGSIVPQTSGATQLPSELPIPTKARNTFVGWYYDSTLKQKAKPNDTINTNITLYAKWYDSLSAFYTDIANLIREFENSSDNIKVTDFADRLRALLESVQ